MATIRVHDSDGVLAHDLDDFLDLLALRSLRATWTVSPVQDGADDLFWATGEGAARLEQLIGIESGVSGTELATLAGDARQIVWGAFVGRLPETGDRAWVTIRAIDSSFYEITTEDEAVLDRIKASCRDVRPADDPWTPPGDFVR